MSSFQTKLMELWSCQRCYTFLRSLILNLIFIPFLLGICKENKIPAGVWEILTLLIPSSVREGWRLWWMMQGWHSLSKDTNLHIWVLKIQWQHIKNVQIKLVQNGTRAFFGAEDEGHHKARRIWAPQPDIKPVTPAEEARIPAHWTAREALERGLLYVFMIRLPVLLETFQTLDSTDQTWLNLPQFSTQNILQSHTLPAKIPLRIVSLSQPPELQEVMTRGKEQNAEAQDAKKLEKSLRWRKALQIGEHSLRQSTLSRIGQHGPQAWPASFPSLTCAFPKWFQFPPSPRGGSRKEGAGKAEAWCFSQWLPELCSDTPADGKWLLIKSLH